MQPDDLGDLPPPLDVRMIEAYPEVFMLAMAMAYIAAATVLRDDMLDEGRPFDDEGPP